MDQPKSKEKEAVEQTKQKSEVTGVESAEMTSAQMTSEALEEFLATGRTGRRNAMPDVSSDMYCGMSTGDLPLELAKLSCSEGASNNPCESTSNINPSPKPS